VCFTNKGNSTALVKVIFTNERYNNVDRTIQVCCAKPKECKKKLIKRKKEVIKIIKIYEYEY